MMQAKDRSDLRPHGEVDHHQDNEGQDANQSVLKEFTASHVIRIEA